MSGINVRIGDGNGSNGLAKTYQREGNSGLLTYTDKFIEEDFVYRAAINNDYGVEMNQNAAFSGTPEEVHDGEDNPYWVFSAITGVKFDPASAAQANTGTQSIETNNGAVNDTMEFLVGGGGNISLSFYSAITLAIYIDKDWAAGDSIEIFGWDSATLSEVGTRVAFQDYFNSSVFGVWHNIVIPLSDMSLASSTIDSIRIEIVTKAGKSPKYYLDDIKIQENGDPIHYVSEPSEGTILRVHEIKLMLIDNILPGGMSWNKLMGLNKLANGIDYQRVADNDVAFSFTIRNLQDILWVQYVPIIQETDGTDTVMVFVAKFREPLILDSRKLDKIVFTIQDDLTGLISMRAAVIGTEENIT